MQGEVDDQAPERRPDDEPLRHRQARVGLPQRNSSHHVANHPQGQQFSHQQRQTWQNRRINAHSANVHRSPAFSQAGQGGHSGKVPARSGAHRHISDLWHLAAYPRDGLRATPLIASVCKARIEPRVACQAPPGLSAFCPGTLVSTSRNRLRRGPPDSGTRQSAAFARDTG